MMVFRLVFGLLLLASVVCLAVSLVTGQAVWRRRGVVLLKWTLLAAVGFFAVLTMERLARLL